MYVQNPYNETAISTKKKVTYSQTRKPISHITSVQHFTYGYSMLSAFLFYRLACGGRDVHAGLFLKALSGEVCNTKTVLRVYHMILLVCH